MGAILHGRPVNLTTAPTKGDLIVGDGTIWRREAVGTNTQKLIADSAQTSNIDWVDDEQWAVKPANQTLTQSSTTLQDVTGLSFALAASTSYAIEVHLLLTAAGTAADWKTGWTFPTSCTMFWGPYGQGGSLFFWIPVGTGTTPDTILTEADTYSFGSAAATTGIIFRGIVRNSTNAGTLQFQASQNTSSATDNTVLKDSYLKIRKLQ